MSWHVFNVTCNVSQLEGMAEGKDSINLGELGIDKLLGSGRINAAMTITVANASASAIEKVEAAGGTVNLEDGDDWDEWEEE